MLLIIMGIIIQDWSKTAKSSRCSSKTSRPFDVPVMTAQSADTQPRWTATSNCSRSLSLPLLDYFKIARRNGGTCVYINTLRKLWTECTHCSHTWVDLPTPLSPFSQTASLSCWPLRPPPHAVIAPLSDGLSDQLMPLCSADILGRMSAKERDPNVAPGDVMQYF